MKRQGPLGTPQVRLPCRRLAQPRPIDLCVPQVWVDRTRERRVAFKGRVRARAQRRGPELESAGRALAALVQRGPARERGPSRAGDAEGLGRTSGVHLGPLGRTVRGSQ